MCLFSTLHQASVFLVDHVCQPCWSRLTLYPVSWKVVKLNISGSIKLLHPYLLGLFRLYYRFSLLPKLYIVKVKWNESEKMHLKKDYLYLCVCSLAPGACQRALWRMGEIYWHPPPLIPLYCWSAWSYEVSPGYKRCMLTFSLQNQDIDAGFWCFFFFLIFIKCFFRKF